MNDAINYGIIEWFFIDTAEGIAHELIGAGLVDSKDLIVVAANLQKLISDQSTSEPIKTVTFALVCLI